MVFQKKKFLIISFDRNDINSSNKNLSGKLILKIQLYDFRDEVVWLYFLCGKIKNYFIQLVKHTCSDSISERENKIFEEIFMATL
mgnify:CR=1 FL=1